MVAAANDLLAALDDDVRASISFDVDPVESQTWANPEFLQFDTGCGWTCSRPRSATRRWS
jgi:hypothetical protein